MPETVPLNAWETFFVIVGGSAGALTGLMFVVIALASGRLTSPWARHAMQAYSTPTIAHFATVVGLSAILSMPGHTRASVSDVLIGVGAGLLGYVAWYSSRARVQQAYTADRSDRIMYFLAPAVAYAGVLAAGITARFSPKAGLYVVAASMLLLLFVGIRNAWDGAVWMVTNQPENRSPD